jgi:hypothetical protein
MYLVLLRVRIECSSGYYSGGVDFLARFLEANLDFKILYECVTPLHVSLW